MIGNVRLPVPDYWRNSVQGKKLLLRFQISMYDKHLHAPLHLKPYPTGLNTTSSLSA